MLFPEHSNEAPRSLSSIVEQVEHGLAWQAHCICLALEPHKRADPVTASVAHRLSTSLRDFCQSVENATSSLTPALRAAIAAR
jgi:hypothetical protein